MDKTIVKKSKDKTKLYHVHKVLNDCDGYKYYSVDVYKEKDGNSIFICECGDWKNEEARKYARKICAYLNLGPIKNKEV